MPVKGKGPMETYFVRGRVASPFMYRYVGDDANSSQNRKSLAAVVFGMVQARRRQTIRGKGELLIPVESFLAYVGNDLQAQRTFSQLRRRNTAAWEATGSPKQKTLNARV